MKNAGFVFSAVVIAFAGCSSPAPTDQAPEPSSPAETPETNYEVVEASAPVQDSQADALLDDRWQVLTLAEQQKSFLLDQYMANAEDLRSRARLEDAYAEVQKALMLEPDYLPAKKLKAELGNLLGKPGDVAAGTLDDAIGRTDLKQQQLYLTGKANMDRGKAALQRGDYDEAIAEFTLAQNHIRWAPAIDWKGIDQEAQTLLEKAKAEKAAAKENAEMEKRRAAFEALQQESAEAKARDAAVTAALVEDAIAAFQMGDYDLAQEKAEAALKNSPRNSQAQDIADAAFRAAHDQANEDYLRRKREKYAEWELEMRRISVPISSDFVAPSEEFWNEITELRANRDGLDLTETIGQDELALRKRLSDTTIKRIEIEETESLITVFDTVKTQTGLPIYVDPAAEEAALDAGAVFAYDFPNAVSAQNFLEMVTNEAGEEVEWTVRHGVVMVTTKEKARGDLKLYSHDVNDLILGLTDFIGPDITRIRLLDDMEDDDGGGPFGGLGERPVLIDPDDLVTLVTDNVAQGTWEDPGVSIDIYQGHLIAVHTGDIQREVKQFLEDLRRFNTSLVTIETKFLTISDNWIQEIGVEWRGIDNPGSPYTDLDDVTAGLEDNAGLGLDNGGTGDGAAPPSAGFFYDDGEDGDFKASTSNIFANPLGSAISTIGGLTSQWTLLDDAQLSLIFRAVEKDNQVELVNDQTLSVFNKERSFITVVNQRAYVQDFDVEAFTGQVAADPQINVIQEGIVLDVRPTINHDRKSITLEARPTVADIVELVDFTTSLGGSTSPVSLQLPELEVKSVYTTVEVPDGGSILLGGLNKIRNVERRAEVPWLAKIPVFGFFFKEEGYNDEKESLMILISARITDITEVLR